MASTKIGKVKLGKGATWYVYRDAAPRDVYVADSGGLFFSGTKRRSNARAKSAADAMRVAQAYVYNLCSP